MSHVITPPPAISAAPILPYHTSTAPPVGLRVEPGDSGNECALELFPPTISAEMGKSVAWATVVAVALALTPLVVIHVRSTEFDPRVGPAACALIFLASWPLMFALRLAAALALRVSFRIEVSPDSVRWTVSGCRLRYETVVPRDKITAVEFRLHGVRLRCRGRRAGHWITFGTRDQQRQICRLLGDALSVPVHGLPKTSAPPA
jgi:hypothetical protein